MSSNLQSQFNTVFQPTPNIPLLPAHTLTRPAPVTPETPKNRDTVTFVTSEGKTQEGTVLYVSWMAITGVTTYYIKSGNKTHACAIDDILPCKMPAATLAPIMDADTAPVLEERVSVKVAKKDILDTLREINEASLIWQHTRDTSKDETLIKKLSDAHDALYAAYLESIGVPQKPSASSREGGSSPSDSHEQRDTSEWPEIASTPISEGTGSTWHTRMVKTEKQFATGFLSRDPLPTPQNTTLMKLAPRKTMTQAQIDNEAEFQAYLAKAMGGAS